MARCLGQRMNDGMKRSLWLALVGREAARTVSNLRLTPSCTSLSNIAFPANQFREKAPANSNLHLSVAGLRLPWSATNLSVAKSGAVRKLLTESPPRSSFGKQGSWARPKPLCNPGAALAKTIGNLVGEIALLANCATSHWRSAGFRVKSLDLCANPFCAHRKE